MAKKKKPLNVTPSTYAETLKVLKERIRTAQIKASLSVNEELLELYWDIGKTIVEKQQEEGWGSKVIERMAKDLKTAFPRMTGLSLRNMLYMKQFFEAYPDLAITQQPVAKIPWGHNVILMDRIKDVKKRLWYAHKTIENGWSRDALETWMAEMMKVMDWGLVTTWQKIESLEIYLYKQLDTIETNCAHE